MIQRGDLAIMVSVTFKSVSNSCIVAEILVSRRYTQNKESTGRILLSKYAVLLFHNIRYDIICYRYWL